MATEQVIYQTTAPSWKEALSIRRDTVTNFGLAKTIILISS